MGSARNLAAIFSGSVLLFLSMANSAVAQDITPQSGIWGIDAENNGKPGRGFQLDAQNNILSLTFYGYQPSGSATWYLAAGAFVAGSNQITMDLGVYGGGMAFGDPLKDATYLGSAGKVTIRFDSVSSGEICLPSEPCKSVSPINFGWADNAAETLGTWVLSGTELANGVPFGAELIFTQLAPSTGPAVVNRATGTMKLGDDGVLVQGPVMCARLVNPAPWSYACSATLSGQAVSFGFDLARNALEGEVYGPQGGVARIFVGFRILTQAGRVTIPN
jgi:hypothetical protein